MNPSPSQTKCAIVGAGKLGCALAEALEKAGYAVVAVSSQIDREAVELCERLSCAKVCSPAEVPQLSTHIFLTVPDAALFRVANQLPVQAHHAMIHTSGGTDLSVFRTASQKGAQIGCFHPLQSFPARHGCSDKFAGITIGVEGSEEIVKWLQTLCDSLGAQMVSLEGCDRALYHAAAVFVSNYLVALFQAATESWTLAGLPRDLARSSLAPLSAGALQAIKCSPLPEALTGPIARGDVATVEGQLNALENYPEYRALYRALGMRLFSMELNIAPQAHRELKKLLSD